MNESVYFYGADGEEYTFAEDGETMRKLFIVQVVFVIPLACCMVFGIMGSVAGAALGHQDGNFMKQPWSIILLAASNGQMNF